MHLHIHLLSSLLLAIVLFPVFGYISLLIIVGGFLVDFDHYLYYILKHKKISLVKAYHLYKKKLKPQEDNRDLLHIFHTIEFWILLIILTIYLRFFILLTFGFFIHMILDCFDLIRTKRYGARALSLIAWLRRHHYL